MILASGFLKDYQRTLEKRFGECEFSLNAVHLGSIVQADGKVGAISSALHFGLVQRLLCQRSRAVLLALLNE